MKIDPKKSIASIGDLLDEITRLTRERDGLQARVREVEAKLAEQKSIVDVAEDIHGCQCACINHNDFLATAFWERNQLREKALTPTAPAPSDANLRTFTVDVDQFNAKPVVQCMRCNAPCEECRPTPTNLDGRGEVGRG